MKKIARRCSQLELRRRVLLVGWLLAAAAVVVRAGQLQVVEGAQWRALAVEQHNRSSEVPAPRGTIVDRDGVPLALTRERIKVSLAPREIANRAAAAELLRTALDLSPREVRKLLEPSRRWSVAPGRYEPTVRAALSGVRGIYLEREMERFYPHGELARGVLGTVLGGVGRGGIEQRYESVLRGRAGREVAARDNAGKEIPGEVLRVDEPAPGGEVRLTLDLDLQEIAHQALTEALDKTGALGGDLLVTDPASGEILALVSVQGERSDGLSAINAPYEPGSTLKPFTVAGLLSRGLASLGDSVDATGGEWTVEGRTVTDTHPYERLTIGDALRVSSNVGIAKAAQPLTPRDRYENLRDFGFGIQAGVELPGEGNGTLRRPDRWSRQSAVSLAIGYEIGVTPMQMALAYGALANGGVLMEPRLVAEVRGGAGDVIETRRPRAVRRVIPESIARELSTVLEDVVEDGTATAARLETFRVAGKTGTSRVNVGGGYLPGRYYSSFVGFFPADDPQLVVFVKLDSPKGAYYGGATAAPVTRAMMEGALAARQTPLDRAALLRSARRIERVPAALAALRGRVHGQTGSEPSVRFANLSESPAAASAAPSNSEPAQPIDGGTPEGATPEAPLGGVSVPDVVGLPARTAVRRLHALGFRVRWQGSGPVAETAPAAGARLEPGDTVSLHAKRSER
ncbi:MAG: PASTA domain-containing protein [Gemmatimonadetes bacterium]|nr:PASTA domain-containing protein [Gemmatimonadota bacterium]